MSTRPARSRLLLRLALAMADGRAPVSPIPPSGRRPEGRAAAGEPADALPDAGRERLEAIAARFDAELAFADGFLDEGHPPSQTELLLANSSELRRAALLQRCVDRAYALRFHDPERGLQMTEDLLGWTQDPSPLVAVVRCRALLERGNFLRILGDRQGAFAALAEASRTLEAHGIDDPLELARHEELLGTLEAYCGNGERAGQLLEGALDKVRRWGDPHALQRVLIATGLTEMRRRRFSRAESLFAEAMAAPEPDSLLPLCAATNRVLGYFAGGDPQLAFRALSGLRQGLGESWLQRLPPLVETRQIWLEGRIHNALGMSEDAAGLLKKARESFIREDRGFDVCSTSVDLALTYAPQRRFAEVERELAFALHFCSEERTLDRYGKEAVQLLLRALVRRGRVEVDLIRAVASRLQWIQHEPLRRFSRSPLAELEG